MMKTQTKFISAGIALVLMLVLAGCSGGSGGITPPNDNNQKPDEPAPVFVNTAPPDNAKIVNDHSLSFAATWDDPDLNKGDEWTVMWFCDKGKFDSYNGTELSGLPKTVSGLNVAAGLLQTSTTVNTTVKWIPPSAGEFCHFTVTCKIIDKGGLFKETIIRSVYNFPLVKNPDPNMVVLRPMPFDPKGIMEQSSFALEFILVNNEFNCLGAAFKFWTKPGMFVANSKLGYPNSFTDPGGRMTKANPQTYTPGGLDQWVPELISQDRISWQEADYTSGEGIDDDYGIWWLITEDPNDYSPMSYLDKQYNSQPCLQNVITKSDATDGTHPLFHWYITEPKIFYPNPLQPGSKIALKTDYINNQENVDVFDYNTHTASSWESYKRCYFKPGVTGIASNMVLKLTDKAKGKISITQYCFNDNKQNNGFKHKPSATYMQTDSSSSIQHYLYPVNTVTITPILNN